MVPYFWSEEKLLEHCSKNVKVLFRHATDNPPVKQDKKSISWANDMKLYIPVNAQMFAIQYKNEVEDQYTLKVALHACADQELLRRLWNRVKILRSMC